MKSAKIRDSEEQVKIPQELPILPLRDMVVYPFIIAPLSVARDISIQAVDRALSENRMIMLVAQRDKEEEDPSEKDLFTTGTVAVIMRMLKLPDGRIRVLVQGVCRARVKKITLARPHFQAKIERVDDQEFDSSSIEKEALMRSIKQLLERASSLGKNLPSEVMVISNNLEDPGRLADLTSSNLDLKVEEAQEVLETLDPVARLKRVHDFLKRELDLHWAIRLVLERLDNRGYDTVVRSVNQGVEGFLGRYNRDEMAGTIWRLPLLQPRLLWIGLKALLPGPRRGVLPSKAWVPEMEV